VTVNRVSTRPTWAEVSLANLRDNFQVVKKHVGRAEVCAVVKADGYGHGAVECSRALEAAGARWFGVTSTDEAIPLCEAGIRGRILIMTGLWRGEEPEVVRRKLTPTVWEPWHIEGLEKAAREQGVERQPVHLKVDTGMGRLGVPMAELESLCVLLQRAPHLHLEGLCTHLASSEVLDTPSVDEQMQRFREAVRMVQAARFSPEILHVANTSAMISRKETWHAMVRPGIALFGYHLPFQRAGREVSGSRLRLNLKPVLTWKTRVLTLREVGANQALGYGGTYITKGPTRIAVLPVGYADGLNRRLSNHGRVILHDTYAPILGRISMDTTLVDVTGIPETAVGDEVILLGSSDGMTVDAREHAAIAETVPYEILCGISKRVPRKYVGSS
jgi:alanine racemase